MHFFISKNTYRFSKFVLSMIISDFVDVSTKCSFHTTTEIETGFFILKISVFQLLDFTNLQMSYFSFS